VERHNASIASKVVGFPSISINDFFNDDQVAQKDVHAKEPVAQKDVLECHAMPYYLKNTTLLLVCS